MRSPWWADRSQQTLYWSLVEFFEFFPLTCDFSRPALFHEEWYQCTSQLCLRSCWKTPFWEKHAAWTSICFRLPAFLRLFRGTLHSRFGFNYMKIWRARCRPHWVWSPSNYVFPRESCWKHLFQRKILKSWLSRIRLMNNRMFCWPYRV